MNSTTGGLITFLFGVTLTFLFYQKHLNIVEYEKELIRQELEFEYSQRFSLVKTESYNEGWNECKERLEHNYQEDYEQKLEHKLINSFNKGYKKGTNERELEIQNLKQKLNDEREIFELKEDKYRTKERKLKIKINELEGETNLQAIPTQVAMVTKGTPSLGYYSKTSNIVKEIIWYWNKPIGKISILLVVFFSFLGILLKILFRRKSFKM